MLRRAKPVPDPDNPGQYLANGARAKSGLNRTISDAGWGRFVSILRAKAEEAGRIWIEVDPRHTSDRCENCGHTAPENRVTQAEFKCRRCGHQRPGRRTRRTQPPTGWTGPSRASCVKEVGGFQPSEKSHSRRPSTNPGNVIATETDNGADEAARDAAGVADAGQIGCVDSRRRLLRAEVGRVPVHLLPRRRRGRARQPQRAADDPLLPRAGRGGHGRTAGAVRDRR